VCKLCLTEGIVKISNMMNQTPKLLDVIALLRNIPEKKLLQGQVGTVVEFLAPSAYEVEFTDNNGRTLALVALKKEDILVLHYELAEAV
jgi:hypothetical protein